MATNVEEKTREPQAELPIEPEPGLAAVEHETHQALAVEQSRLDAMLQAGDPNRITAWLENRSKALATLRRMGIAMTKPADWTLYKGKDGTIVGVPSASACATIRKLYGITIGNYRPRDARGIADPTVQNVETGKGKKVMIVELFADGYCNVTGEAVPEVYFSVRSDDDFRGRNLHGEAPGRDGEPRVQDMKSACRTGLDSRITRVLTGLTKVTDEELRTAGVDVEKCRKGQGFGTSADRGAQTVAAPDVKTAADAFREEILKRVNGDPEAAKALLKELTAGNKPGKDGKVFPGWDNVSRFTELWQIDAAWKKLRAHSVFGDSESSETEAETKK
jgi:hypothetical protein